jgi:uncharacterized protein YegP (UPF0339 family)
MRLRLPRFELFKDAGGSWRWRMKAAINEILCVSEAYSSKSAALKGAKTARAASRFAIIRIKICNDLQ